MRNIRNASTDASHGKGVGNKREGELMLLTIFLTIVFCVAMTLMMFSEVAFIQDNRLS